MPHTSTFSSLKTDIRLWTARSDTDFMSALPTFITMAEQRIAYGSSEPFPSDPVRVRDQKITVEIPIENGVAVLPDNYLEQSSLTLKTDLGKRLTYRPEEEFDSLISLGGLPSVFTIKGAEILVKPTNEASAVIFTYYARFPELINDGDTNWILLNAPSIYLKGSLIEAYGFTRNKEARDSAYADYIAAANGLTMQTRGSLQGVRLSPSVPGVGNLRRIGGF